VVTVMTLSPEQREEIQKALNAATPGPWEVTDTGVLNITKDYRYENGNHIANWIAEIDSHDEGEGQLENAWLISNAPEWLRLLLSSERAWKAEAERLREVSDLNIKNGKEAIEQLSQAVKLLHVFVKRTAIDHSYTHTREYAEAQALISSLSKEV
jgi:hypothetical protein